MIMKHKSILTLFGFIIFFTGTLAVVLSMIGVRFAIFSALEDYSRMGSFLVYLFLMIIGMLLIVIPNTDLKNDEEIVEP